MIQTSFLWYIGAFAVALGVLIVVHELGHYLVARRVGVKVLRFSVGFGKPLLSRRFGPDRTEWVLAAFPLGGYVKMLDEREEAVAPEELHRAFNRQSVGRRALVVMAGPVANLLLAIALYWFLFVTGVDEMRPLLGAPLPGTAAAHAGVEDGDEVRSVSDHPVATLQEFRWQLMKRIADRQPVRLEVMNQRGEIHFRTITTESLAADALDADFVRHLGLAPFQPKFKPVIGLVAADSVAEAVGLAPGDLVQAIDGDEPELRARLMIEVRLGPLEALLRAADQTWDTSIFSLRMIGRMLVGEQSWKNISGPVTIADYAGQSARLGLDPFLKFLALISISLGVLNLLPIPILDGGHLLYYFFEVIKGGPLSERAMEIGQQIGIGLLALLMAFAFFNDINRLISG